MAIVKFKDKQYDLSEMDRASLLDLKSKIDFDGSRLQAEITEAKRNAYENGIYTDPDWYKNASIARKIFAKNSQKIQTEFSKRKALRQQNGKLETRTFLSVFNDICKHELDRELYNKIAKQAHEISRDSFCIGFEETE